MPETSTVLVECPKKDRRLIGGLFICVSVLVIAFETALATDPRIDIIERFGTNWVTLHFNTDAHRTYTLQYSSGGEFGTWSNFYTIPADVAPNHYVVVAPATNGCRFYRLAVSP